LILVTGATGSGKSTLAAMVIFLTSILRTYLTLEDPVEYRYTSERCLYQREIGVHCLRFFAAGFAARYAKIPT
jgi:twitching motility protein PilT